MSSNNLTIRLSRKTDKAGADYFIGKLESPILIDAAKGVAFLIFTSEDGCEEMQICPMIKKERREDKNDVDFDD